MDSTEATVTSNAVLLDNSAPNSSTAEAIDSPAHSTATLMANVPSSQERRLILDEYERCFKKHGSSLSDLLRLHQKEIVMNKKLTVSLEQATKNEMKEREKVDLVNKTIEELLRGICEIIQKPEQHGSNKPEALRRAIEHIKKDVEDYVREKDILDRNIDELKAQIEHNAFKIDGKRTSDADIATLSQKVDESKTELISILRSLNQSLMIINNRLHTSYSVPEDPEFSSVDFRQLLDKLLEEVISIVTDRKMVSENNRVASKKIEDSEKHVEQCRRMNDLLANEAKKLLTIDDRSSATRVDPTNLEEVRKFVEETFKKAVESLSSGHKEFQILAEAKEKAERELQSRTADMQKEIAVKQTKMEADRDTLSKLQAQNEFLRLQLSREEESPEVKAEAEISNAIKQLNDAADGCQNAALRAQLEHSRVQNEQCRRQLAELSTAINETDEIVANRRAQLQELNEKAENDRETNRAKAAALDKNLVDTNQEIMDLEHKLIDLNKRSEEAKGLKVEIKKLYKIERESEEKIQEIEEQIKAIEEDRLHLTTELKKQIEECDALRVQLRNEDIRRESLEEKLQDIKEKSAETDRRIERERERTVLLGRDTGRGTIAAPYNMAGVCKGIALASQASIAIRQRQNMQIAQLNETIADKNYCPEYSTRDLDLKIRGLEQKSHVSRERRDSLLRKLDELQHDETLASRVNEVGAAYKKTAKQQMSSENNEFTTSEDHDGFCQTLAIEALVD